ncbi:Putative F-box/FBD/LRR-repeat protein At4g13965 [Linum perenne]
MDRGIPPSPVRNSDRLSALPDEIIRRILIAADLNLKSTVQTSVLSRRWRSIWKSCLTKLDFNIPQSDRDEWNSFVPFVENVISFHNHEYVADLEVLSVSTGGRILSPMFDLLGRIFAHGLRNRVRMLRLAIGWNCFIYSVPLGLTELCDLVENLELSFRNDEIHTPWTMNFSAVRTLRLYQCSLRPFPGTLNHTVQRYDPFGWIPNLTELEVIECDFSYVIYPVKISSNKLVHLALVNPKVKKLEIFAPQLESFVCKGTIEEVFGDPDRILSLEIPALKCLDIDIYLDREILSWEEEKEASLKVIRFVQRFHVAKRVKLHPGIIKALTMVPGLLEHEDSPFKNVHSLEFHNIDDLISSRRVFNALVSYFFDDCIRGTALFERVITRLGTLYICMYLCFPLVVYL